MSSWLIGTSGLLALLASAVLISRSRPFARIAEAQRQRLVTAGLLAVLVQVGHVVEEARTGFPVAFPATLGLEPWSDASYVSFNLFWLALWSLALYAAPRGAGWAEWPLWFLALAMVANGIVHPVLALSAAGYFPGLWTAGPSFLAGGLLLERLVPITSSRRSGRC